MKKLFGKISSFFVAVFLLVTAVGCSFFDFPTQKFPKLPAPEVTIDSEGVASWNRTDGTLYYVYVIDDGEEMLTIERSVQLAENQSIRVKAVSDGEAFDDSDFSAPKTYKKSSVQTKLLTPQVSINESGVASWGKVANAQYYIYIIDNNAEIMTSECSVQLTENQSIKVKAGSSEAGYEESDFSQPRTYIKGLVQITLATPQVSVNENGVASWNKITNAQYYVYVIDDGAETTTSACSVQLAENQSIKVKAASNEVKYADSNFSQAVTYVKNIAHKHADANADGICDTCKESVKAELSFFAVNDLHGKFMDTSSQPGLDEFTTYLKTLYKDTVREEILLSSGDMWQGTVESSSNKGQLMTEWMNEVGFASMTLGNHEYDWGAQVLTPNSQLANFPFLAINVTYNGKPVDYCQGSTTVEKGGVKIGIIGAIGNCLSSISGDYKPGLSFATGDALTNLVKAESERLRKEEGCDFIVYSIHDGYDSSLSGVTSVTGDLVTGSGTSQYTYYDTALSDGYVDLVFEGHTHQSYIIKDEYGVYHLQGGGENSYVSRVDVSYNTVTAKYTVTPSLVSKSVYASSSIKDDPVIEELYAKYFPDEDPYTAVLGTNTSKRDDTAICDAVAKLYYEKGVETWGKSYNIVLGGGYLKTRSPYNVYTGNVTYAQLFSVLPFDNEIVLGKIQGTYLKSKFLETTLSTYHVYATITSSQVTNSNYYYIIVDSYSSTYASNRITEVARLGSGTYARDLLADFVSKGGWGSGTKSTVSCGDLMQTYTALTGVTL